MSGGRPLRFLAVTIGGWVAFRAVALWPSPSPVPETASRLPTAGLHLARREPGRGLVMLATSSSFASVPSRAASRPDRAAAHGGADRFVRAAGGSVASVPPPAVLVDRLGPAAMPGGAADPGFAAAPAPQLATIPPPVPTAAANGAGRLHASVWAIARGGGRADLLGGQLGASQAGARVIYAVGGARRLALAARVATPLHGPGREAGLGLDWQPTHAPIHMVVEQRVFLDGGRGGPSVSAIGGVGPTAIGHGMRIEAYGQAGGIARGRIDGFADGSLRVTRSIAALAHSRIDIGAGAWGGAQRGAARLDVGPSLAMAVPVRAASLRLTLDWRARIAGNARPGSGPALSIGSDF